MRRTAMVVTACALVAGACSDDGRGVDAFCSQLDSMQEIDLTVQEIDLDDSVAVNESLAEFTRQFEQLAEVSPEQISDDTAIVARFAAALADAALAANPDDPFDRAALLASATTAEPRANDAMDRLSQFAARNCTATP